MASTPPEKNDLVIQKTSLSTNQADSRLIKRGLRALDEVRKMRLDVEKLVAFGSSLFVFAKDWDPSAWGRYEIPAWRQFLSQPPDKRSEVWNGRRQVTFFEFRRIGTYIRKVELPLIKLTAEGFAKIQDRDCVSITIRSGFIYFRENLWMKVDSGTSRCDVHYLFSRTGERLAIWSSSALVEQYRVHHEATVPTVDWLDPDLIDETSMITFRRGDESLDAPPRQDWFDEEFDAHASTSIYSFTSQDVEQWITHIRDLQQVSVSTMRSFPLTMCEHRTVAVAPSESLSYYFSQVVVGPDPKNVWLLDDEKRENPAIVRSIMKLDMDATGPQMTTYYLPHPYHLIRQGMITLLDENNNARIASEADFNALQAEYERQFSADPDADYEGEYYEVLGGWSSSETEYEGRYTWCGSWEDEIVVATSFKNQQPDEDRQYHFILFKVEGDNLHAVKALNSGRTENLYWRTPTFADGHLFLAIAEWDQNREAHDWTIRVANVNTDAVDYLHPEVPEFELEDLVQST